MSCDSLFSSPGAARTGGGSQVSRSKRSGPQGSIESNTRIRKGAYVGTSKSMISSTSKKNVTLAAGSDKIQAASKPPIQVVKEQFVITLLHQCLTEFRADGGDMSRQFSRNVSVDDIGSRKPLLIRCWTRLGMT